MSIFETHKEDGTLTLKGIKKMYPAKPIVDKGEVDGNAGDIFEKNLRKFEEKHPQYYREGLLRYLDISENTFYVLLDGKTEHEVKIGNLLKVCILLNVEYSDARKMFLLWGYFLGQPNGVLRDVDALLQWNSDLIGRISPQRRLLDAMELVRNNHSRISMFRHRYFLSE